MPCGQADIRDSYVRGRRVMRLRKRRVAAHRPMALLESAHTSGTTFEVPAANGLMLSQSVGRPFRYICDIGAGRFSGHTQPGDFVAVVPGSASWCRVTESARLRFMEIPGDLARACLERDPGDPLDFGAIHAGHQGDPLIVQGLQALWQELDCGDPAARLFVDSMMSALVVRLARLAHRSVGADERRGGLAPHQSACVIEYMQVHLDRRITLAELAGLCGLSPWHFSRCFRNTHGCPPHRYLTRLRVQRARELLECTAFSITEIAAMTGYTPQLLVRHFRKATGLPPGKYRNLFQRHTPVGR